MTKEELKSALKDFGTRGKQVAEEIYTKLEEEKETMDTDTRRKTRAFWAFVAIFAFGIGVAVGHWLI